MSADQFENNVYESPPAQSPASPRSEPLTDRLRLRAAAFRTFKRLLVADQTLATDGVSAGFNQFTDEFNQTSAWVKGVV